MPRTINRIELLGRVGTEPEMRYAPSGTAITRLRLATDRPTADGKTEAEWHTVICWGKLGEAVNQYVQKGGRIYLSGRLHHRAYEDGQGEKRYQAEVHANEVVFLDGKPNGAEPAAPATAAAVVQTDEPPIEDLPF